MNCPPPREKWSKAEKQKFKGERKKIIRVCSPSWLQKRRHEPRIHNWSVSAPEIPWRGLAVVRECVRAQMGASCASISFNNGDSKQVRWCRDEMGWLTAGSCEMAFRPPAMLLCHLKTTRSSPSDYQLFELDCNSLMWRGRKWDKKIVH